MISSTIVALASPPGIGALHVIRMSGPNSFPIINSVSLDKVEKTVDRLQVTFIKSRNNMLIDQVVLMKFYAPFSYTGEDCIEISCHGNGLISKLIIDELIKNGARHAERGEFTKRAFLNNKIDLNQALNIGNLFKASSEVDIYSSVQEIRGATSSMINKYLDDLLSLIGECELNIDYPPEIHEDSLFLEDVRKKIKQILHDLENLYLSSKKQKLSNYRIVFVGKPNAGKSSLINYLIGKDRIIVSDRAGTTTDSIEVDFCIDGYILTLVDTAGIEDITDKYEYTEKSKQEIKNSDLLIYLSSCEDSESDEFWDFQLKGKDVIKIITKNDLIQHKPPNSISVKNSDVKYFYAQIRKFLSDNYVSVGVKSLDNINNLNDSILELRKSLSIDIPVDLVSEHLRNAYDHLSLIVRKTLTNADKINSMFDNFCVGK